MVKNLSYKRVILIFLGFLMLLSTAGCNSEDETYDMKTDEEFLEAVDIAVELLLQEQDDDNIYENLYKNFSARYPEHEIRAYVEARVDEEKETFNHLVDQIGQRIAELENQIDDYLIKLENQDQEDDINKAEKIEIQLKPFFDWLDELDDKLENTADHNRIIELMEEKENTYEEMVTILNNQVQSGQSHRNAERLEKRDMLNYYHEIENILEKDNSIFTRFDSVTGEDYISDQVLHDELERYIMPESKLLLEELKKVKVESDEIRQIHYTYKQGWELKIEGFVLLARAIKEEDEIKREQANELIEEGNQLRGQFLEELNKRI